MPNAAEHISSNRRPYLRRLRDLRERGPHSSELRWSGTVRGADDRRQTLTEASAQSPTLSQITALVYWERDPDIERLMDYSIQEFAAQRET